MMRNRDNPLVIFSVILLTVVFAVSYIRQGNENDKLRAQITKLNHACIPTYTGGGVTQCAQPNIRQTSAR